MEHSIVTHDGKFHADEVMACAILQLALGELSFVRTRNITKVMLEDEDCVVIDVGGEFDPSRRNFDHHMNNGPVRSSGVPYSSAGLIWDEYGHLLTGGDHLARSKEWLHIDNKIEEIDAGDNGQGKFSPLQSIIAPFNGAWNEGSPVRDALFYEALSFTKTLLERWIVIAKAKVRAEDIVLQAIEDSNDEVLVLPSAIPWHDVFFEKPRPHRFIIFEAGAHDWRVQCIPPSMKESFDQRLPFPKEWAGLVGEEFENVCGIKDVKFCHKGRFILGTYTPQAALALIQLTQHSATTLPGGKI